MPAAEKKDPPSKATAITSCSRHEEAARRIESTLRSSSAATRSISSRRTSSEMILMTQMHLSAPPSEVSLPQVPSLPFLAPERRTFWECWVRRV